MSLRENGQAAQERDRQQAEADGAGHRRYAKAWELHKLGVPVMSPNGAPDPALTETALAWMLAAEQGRRATLYETFARTGIVTVFPALDVQILTGDGIVYTIGNHDPLTQTNSSRPLGLLAGAEAMVTDGPQVPSHGLRCSCHLRQPHWIPRPWPMRRSSFPTGPSTFTRCTATSRSLRRRNRSRGSTPWLMPLLRRPPRWTPGRW